MSTAAITVLPAAVGTVTVVVASGIGLAGQRASGPAGQRGILRAETSEGSTWPTPHTFQTTSSARRGNQCH